MGLNGDDNAPINYAALIQSYVERATRQALGQPTDATYANDPDALLYLLTVALKAPSQWQEARDLLFHLNGQFDLDGRYNNWETFLTQGIDQSAVVGDHETRAILQIYLGNLHRIQGRADKSLLVLQESAKYLEKNSSAVWFGSACNGIARTLQQQGEAADARVWTQKALAVLPVDSVNERAVSHRIQGSAAIDLGRWDIAYSEFVESLRLWRLGNDPRLIAFGLTNVGSALRGLTHYAPAYEALADAISIFQKVGDRPNEGIAHINLGNIHLMQAQFPEAIEQYHQAEQLLRQSKDIVRLAGIYNNWGMAYVGTQEWERAIRAYKQSISLWERAEIKPKQANVTDNLGLALAAIGRFQESLECYENALALMVGYESLPLYPTLLEHKSNVEKELLKINRQ